MAKKKVPNPTTQKAMEEARSIAKRVRSEKKDQTIDPSTIAQVNDDSERIFREAIHTDSPEQPREVHVHLTDSQFASLCLPEGKVVPDFVINAAKEAALPNSFRVSDWQDRCTKDRDPSEALTPTEAVIYRLDAIRSSITNHNISIQQKMESLFGISDGEGKCVERPLCDGSFIGRISDILYDIEEQTKLMGQLAIILSNQ